MEPDKAPTSTDIAKMAEEIGISRRQLRCALKTAAKRNAKKQRRKS